MSERGFCVSDVFQTERHFIMQVVCEATQCLDTRVSTIGRGSV